MASTMTRFAQANSEKKRTLTPLLAASRDSHVPTRFVWPLMKRLARVVSLERRAGLLAATLPARYWFRAAVLMSRWHALLTNIFGKSRRGISEAYLREHWLVELSRRGPFPVPLRVTGAELLAPSAFDRGGVVLCATHVPLLMVMLRAAILSGHKPELVLAHPDNMTWGDNAVQPTGLSEGVPAVPPGPGGLLKIRTILRKKGLVSCTLDRHAGGPNHPDVLVLAGRLGARIVIFRADLAPDGVVNVSFRHPMHPYCES